jgi:hypothetical protein
VFCVAQAIDLSIHVVCRWVSASVCEDGYAPYVDVICLLANPFDCVVLNRHSKFHPEYCQYFILYATMLLTRHLPYRQCYSVTTLLLSGLSRYPLLHISNVTHHCLTRHPLIRLNPSTINTCTTPPIQFSFSFLSSYYHTQSSSMSRLAGKIVFM